MSLAEGAAVRVMLVDDADRGRRVEECLRACGYETVLATATAGLLFLVEQHQPDVVLMDVRSPDGDMLESLAVMACHNPIPVVVFCRESVSEGVRQMVSSGGCFCQLGGIVPELAGEVVEMALAQFRTQQALRDELRAARLQLEGRTVVERAKKLLMSHRQLDEDSAHRLLTKLAMDSNQRLPAVARAVISKLSAGE